jgi:hypothetical protein
VASCVLQGGVSALSVLLLAAVKAIGAALIRNRDDPVHIHPLTFGPFLWPHDSTVRYAPARVHADVYGKMIYTRNRTVSAKEFDTRQAEAMEISLFQHDPSL